MALVGDYSQIDLFGSTLNLCSKVNSSSSLSIPNEVIIGANFYRILKSFSSIDKDYNFSNNGEYKITETYGYPTYNLQRKRSSLSFISINNDTSSYPNAQSRSFIFENSLVDNNYYISE